MRKASVVPKIAITILLLVIAVILSFPVVGVASSRIFGGGIVDISDTSVKEYHNSKPAEGRIHFIANSASGDNTGGALDKGAYYYLIPKGGNKASKSNKVDTYILVKVIDGSDEYNGMNDVVRECKDGESVMGYGASGVFKTILPDEKKLGEKMMADKKLDKQTLCEFVLDISTPVGYYTTRFYISLVFYAVGIFGIYLVITSINKNSDIEEIEVKRMLFKMEQDRKSGNKNDDGSDRMFGAANDSFGAAPSGDGSDGGYKPTFQSQGGGSQDDPFAGSMMSDGGSGGGFLDDSDYQGGSTRGGFLDDSGYQGGSTRGGFLDDSGYQGGSTRGGFLDDSSYQGGGGGFMGGGQPQDNNDYDGFFGG